MTGRAAALVLATLSGGWRCPQPAVTEEVHRGFADPRSLAAFDVDGDGDQDVVVAESGAGRATLLLNDGRGGLRREARTLPSGPGASHVVAVDLDRDGDLDLVFANHETSGITRLENLGAGSFGPPVALEAGSRPHLHAVAAADVDGDKAVDLGVDSVDDHTVRVLFGGALPVVAVAACELPYYKLGAGDVTGDGVADLLVPCQRANQVAVLSASGPRALAVAATVPLPDKPWVIHAADLTGDARPELVVVHETSVSVLGGDARAGFAPVAGSPFAVPGATDVAAGDLDGDRVADLAIGPWRSDEVTVLRGGSFRRATVRVAERPIALAIADLDGDGRGELIAASPVDGTVRVVRLAP